VVDAPGVLPGCYACVDLETTGGDASRHRVIEVGLVLMEHGRVVEEWSSLVQPGVRIPPYITDFTGITNEMIADAPAFAGIADEIWHRLQGRVFVAHNARFDYGFLRNEFRRLGRMFRAPVLCTVKLSRRLYPAQPRHNLDAVMEAHGLSCESRHRALGDARVLADLLALLPTRHPLGHLQATIEALQGAVRLPPQLPADLADELPEGPGVYRFFAEQDVLLYVGKSTNLRARVLDHFTADHRSSSELELSRQVHRVDWLETAGELGALLLEAVLVKREQPLINRRLRQADSVYTWSLNAVAGALRPMLVAVDTLEGTEGFGLFRSRKAAARSLDGVIREHELCRRVLGLESGAGSCFARQLGRCRGACSGTEPLALHNARLQLALARQKLRPWPFAGRVGLCERGPSAAEVHVLDQWRYLGSAVTDEQIEALAAAALPPFDPDIYRLLARLLNRRRLDVIELGDRADGSRHRGTGSSAWR